MTIYRRKQSPDYAISECQPSGQHFEQQRYTKYIQCGKAIATRVTSHNLADIS